MKKMLTLVLVLIVASLANASLSFYVNGSAAGTGVTINTGQTLTIQINSSDDLAWNAYVIQGTDTVSGVGALTNAVDLVAAGNMSSHNIYAAGDGWGNGFLFGTGGSPVTPPVIFSVVAGLQHTVDFASAVMGTATIHLYEGSDPYGELDSIAVTVIPEPVTMALLGLGGLFLRRRK